MESYPESANIMPVVALRGLVVMPGAFVHFDVGRKKSIAAVAEAMSSGREIFLVAQKDIGVEDPEQDDLYQIGVIATISQTLKVTGGSNGPVRVAVEGLRRARLDKLIPGRRCLHGAIAPVTEKNPEEATDEYLTALVRYTKDLFSEYMEVAPQLPSDVVNSTFEEYDAGRLADYIAGNIMLEYRIRQEILQVLSPAGRLEKVCVILSEETRLMGYEAEIQETVQSRMDEGQREFYLREQLKVISEELNGSEENEIEEYREKIRALDAPDDVKDKLLKCCSRLEKYSVQSPEAAVERNYLDAVLDLPWGKSSVLNISVGKARKILDDDHYGMEKIKERVLELIAVGMHAPDVHAPIICLSGPPGVGKTSVARSIARATGREYVRVSLGGVKDEAEIRGHRKTYIGSMPGRIIEAITKAGTVNPVVLLDEVDKLSSDYKGDPTSALLEVLDPEQNNSFRDHYIEMPFDLSKVLFVTTANLTANIPAPLRDRMEMIELGSYTHEEKFHIAKKHLIKKQMKRHELTSKQFRITDKAVHAIIDGYTSEAGVRTLEQEISKICRKVIIMLEDGAAEKVSVTPDMLPELLGTAKFKKEKLSGKNETGAVNGLAWTQVGGELLTVEAVVMDGSGKLELTGSLGDVMQESAKAAVSLIRSRCGELAVENEFWKNKDIHLHFPEGATPKDGPSAGVTISTALVSALTGAPVRGDVAMTGEISLRGKVLPIGGLKEKSMAAYRAGIKTVIIPEDNISDLDEVDSAVKEAVEFVPVKTVDAVWRKAFANTSWQRA